MPEDRIFCVLSICVDIVFNDDKLERMDEVRVMLLLTIAHPHIFMKNGASPRKRRGGVKLDKIFELVPRGNFEKNNLTEVFDSPLQNIMNPDLKYSDLLSFSNYAQHSAKFVQEYNGSSYADASFVLHFNTEYPVSMLDTDFINTKVHDNYKREILDSCEIGIKYKGYIQREQQMAEKIMRLENLVIPENFDFDRVESLSIECRQKLKKYAPRTIAQASRISGVSPADVSVLLVYFGR